MLEKFKALLHKYFASHHYPHQDELTVKNHIVIIKDVRYFLAKAMVTDAPEIVKVERAVSKVIPWKRSILRRDLRQRESRLYLVLRRHDQMVAFIGCHFDYQNKDCHISNIAVVPNYQNRGLGYFLLTAIIKRARDMNQNTVTLEVRKSNQNAINLYHDLGFEDDGIVHDYYYDNHEDALKMVLNITEVDDTPNNYGL